MQRNQSPAMRKKEKIVDMLHKAGSNATALLVLNYKNVSMGLLEKFRNHIKALGDTVVVANNKLVCRAIHVGQFSTMEKFLKGQNIFIFSKDIVKVLYLLRKNRNFRLTFSMVVCNSEGELLNQEAINQLSLLKSKEHLLMTLMEYIKYPITKLQSIVSAIKKV